MANKKKKLFQEDYLFHGKYVQMVKDLTNVIDPESQSKIFNSAVELYVISALIGILNDEKAMPETGEQDFRIMSSQFTNHYDDLVFTYDLVMLNANKESLTAVDRINNAFRYSQADDEYQANADLYEQYMLGGLTLLYDHFIKQSNVTYEDYLNSLDELINKYSIDKGDVKNEEIDFGPVF